MDEADLDGKTRGAVRKARQKPTLPPCTVVHSHLDSCRSKKVHSFSKLPLIFAIAIIFANEITTHGFSYIHDFDRSPSGGSWIRSGGL